MFRFFSIFWFFLTISNGALTVLQPSRRGMIHQRLIRITPTTIRWGIPTVITPRGGHPIIVRGQTVSQGLTTRRSNSPQLWSIPAKTLLAFGNINSLGLLTPTQHLSIRISTLSPVPDVASLAVETSFLTWRAHGENAGRKQLEVGIRGILGLDLLREVVRAASVEFPVILQLVAHISAFCLVVARPLEKYVCGGPGEGLVVLESHKSLGSPILVVLAPIALVDPPREVEVDQAGGWGGFDQNHRKAHRDVHGLVRPQPDLISLPVGRVEAIRASALDSQLDVELRITHPLFPEFYLYCVRSTQFQLHCVDHFLFYVLIQEVLAEGPVGVDQADGFWEVVAGRLEEFDPGFDLEVGVLSEPEPLQLKIIVELVLGVEDVSGGGWGV